MRSIALVACAFAFLLISAGTADAARNKNNNGFNSEYNQPSYWGDDCKKFEQEGEVTLWTITRSDVDKVIVKGGPAIETYENVNGQEQFAAPYNPNSGKLYGISHVIECYGETEAAPQPELDCDDEDFVDEEGICDETETLETPSNPPSPENPTQPEESGEVLGTTSDGKGGTRPETLAETGVDAVTTIAAGTLLAVAAIGLSALRVHDAEELAEIAL